VQVIDSFVDKMGGGIGRPPNSKKEIFMNEALTRILREAKIFTKRLEEVINSADEKLMRELTLELGYKNLSLTDFEKILSDFSACLMSSKKDFTHYGTKILNNVTNEKGLLICTWSEPEYDCEDEDMVLMFATCVSPRGEVYSTELYNIIATDEHKDIEL
jgi:hypothetical protein